MSRLVNREGPSLKQALSMPWTIQNEIRRYLTYPWIRTVFAVNGITWGKRWRVYGTPILQRHKGSSITLGNGIELRSWPSSNPLSPNHPVVLSTRLATAYIRIGHDVAMTGSTVVAAESVEIGDRVLIGANSVITDFDFHPLDPQGRRENILAGAHSPVVIEDDVFIGMNSIILKGVKIGKCAVIGAGSVVTRDVAPAAVVAGNPVTVTRTLTKGD